jgi:hypothetical protein
VSDRRSGFSGVRWLVMDSLCLSSYQGLRARTPNSAEEMRQTSATGGSAGKRGDRYEMRWTILRGAFPVLIGNVETITIEPPGTLGEGIEFRLDGPSGAEVHQAKRERAASQWTIHALIEARVLDRLGVHLTDASTRAVFVSGTGASDLNNLTRRARLPDAASWRNDLTKGQTKAADDLIEHWNVDDETARLRLSRLTIETVSHEFLNAQVKLTIGMLVEGDEMAAVEVLDGFLSDELNRPVGSDELWTLLRSAGHPPRDGQGNRAISERLRNLAERYASGVEATRPTLLPYLERPEVDSALSALGEASGSRSAAIVGTAGSGKSSVVSAVVRKLRSQGVVVAAVRLDQLAPSPTAHALGREAAVDLEGSIANALGRAAKDAAAVLAIDQLDALSAVSGRGEVIVEGVRETLLQARALPNIHVLVACRAHDLEHDRGLRTLLEAVEDPTDGEVGRPTIIPVGDLDDPQLDALLQTLGISLGAVHPRLRGLLRNFFNLSLLALLVEDLSEGGEPFDLETLNTRLDLLHRVDRRFARQIRALTGSTDYGASIQHLALMMSDAGRLSLPESTTLSDQLDLRDALQTAGVLVSDSGSLRFFHQSYFEYAFAQGHLRNGLTAMNLVRDDMQDIMRRGQVRAVLALERESDLDTYMTDLRSLLGEEGVRTHIRATVLDFLGDKSDLLDGEVQLIKEVAGTVDHPLHSRAMWTLFRPGVARYLAQAGLIDQIGADFRRALAGATQGAAAPWLDVDADDLQWILANVARTCPEQVAVAVHEISSNVDLAPLATAGILRIAFVAGEGSGPKTSAMFVELMDSLRASVEAATAEDLGAPLSTALQIAYSLDAVHALHSLALRSPEGAVAAFDSWIALADAISIRSGGGPALSRKSSVLPDSLKGLDTLERMVLGAGRRFVELLVPRLLAAMRAERLPTTFKPAGVEDGELFWDSAWPHGSPYLEQTPDEVINAVTRALKLERIHDPNFVLSVVNELVGTEQVTAHVMAASVLADSSADQIKQALAWARRPSVRGLPYAGSTAWAWGTVLGHVVEAGSAEQRAEATKLVLDPYRDLDLTSIRSEMPLSSEELSDLYCALEQHSAAGLVLRAWRGKDEDPPDELVERCGALEGLFGPVREIPGPDLIPMRPEGGVSNEVAQNMSDEEWLAHLRENNPPDRATLSPTGPEFELSRQLLERAREEPPRFAKLLARLTEPELVRFSSTILAGISQSNAILDEQSFDDVLSGLRLVWNAPSRCVTNVCQVIGQLSTNHRLPDDIVEMVSWTITNAEDPPEDGGASQLMEDRSELSYRGINCERGFGISVATRLLGSRHGESYIQALVPALATVPGDPSEQVRMQLPSALLRYATFNATDTVDILKRWLASATDVSLDAVELPRLAYWVGSHDPVLAVEIAVRMVSSDREATRAIGGNLATYLAWREQTGTVPGGNATEILATAMDEVEARVGIALATSDLVDSLTDDLSEQNRLPVGWSVLLKLLDDEEKRVRDNASRFVHNLSRELEAYSSLLEALAGLTHLDDIAPDVFFTLRHRGGELPETLIALLERWISSQGAEMGNAATSAYGTGMNVTELVFDLHAQSPRGSAMRSRCLDIIDRLIELGAVEVLGVLEQIEE